MPILRTALFLALFALVPLTAPLTAKAQSFDQLATGGVGGWLNVTRPLTVDDMKGRLVLLDFWTYGCINCMQIAPDLEKLEEMFGDRLLIIGVHSAKFKGEQGSDRILDAAKRFGLKHPVANDSDYAIWKTYKVNAWPTQVLLGPGGTEINRYVGEGHLEKIKADVAANVKQVTNTTSVAALVNSENAKGTLSFPARMAVGPEGTLFVADSGHNRILQIDQNGKIKATIGSGTRGLKDGTYNNAQFNLPRGMVMFDEKLYVADTNNHAIRKIDLKKQIVETIAGHGQKGDVASPWDLETLDDNRSIAVAMAGRHQLWSLNTRSDKLSVLAGSSAEALIDGRANTAALAQPSGLSSLPDGTLYFVDAESSALRMLNKGDIKTLIGTGLFDFGKEDGVYPAAKLQHPQGLAASADAIYIADTYNDAIRVYDRKTGTLSTLDLPADSLREPGDVLLVANKLWIADTNHHTIKVYDLDSKILTEIGINP